MEPTSQEFDTLYQLALDETVRTGKTSLARLTEAFSLPEGTAKQLLKKMCENGTISPTDRAPEEFTPNTDSLYQEVEVWAVKKEELSLTDIQRGFKLSWSRAKRLLLALEYNKVISSGELGDKRKVFVKNVI